MVYKSGVRRVSRRLAYMAAESLKYKGLGAKSLGKLGLGN